MAIDVTRHEPDDDPPWIEATHEGVSYRFQIVGEDELQLTATGTNERVDTEPPAPVLERLDEMGYPEVRT